jgi:hypothetical protein
VFSHSLCHNPTPEYDPNSLKLTYLHIEKLQMADVIYCVSDEGEPPLEECMTPEQEKAVRDSCYCGAQLIWVNPHTGETIKVQRNHHH